MLTVKLEGINHFDWVVGVVGWLGKGWGWWSRVKRGDKGFAMLEDGV